MFKFAMVSYKGINNLDESLKVLRVWVKYLSKPVFAIFE
jgi:hypothetical protein